jgi:hypothetical protein
MKILKLVYYFHYIFRRMFDNGHLYIHNILPMNNTDYPGTVFLMNYPHSNHIYHLQLARYCHYSSLRACIARTLVGKHYGHND